MGSTGATGTQASEYLPTAQNVASIATPSAESYTTATIGAQGYDPDAEWAERRQRSRERVAMALQEDATVGTVSVLGTVDNSSL